MRPKLTIGMPTFDDFDGVYFTIQNLRINHNSVATGVEILVVDNNPTSNQGKAVKKLCGSLADVRYVPDGDSFGTAYAKNRVFDEASGEIVVCMDCHVLPRWPNFCQSVIDYFKEPIDDLIQGPLFLDGLTHLQTHLDPVWRGSDFGIWGMAREYHDGRLVSFQETSDGIIYFVLTGDKTKPVDVSNWSKLPIVGSRPDDPEFTIPAQGMGLFISRKESWLGFNRNFRGFGAEEYYIHTKYWNSGRKCLCVPKFGWVHRFGRPLGPSYPLLTADKVRNYVIGHSEVGLPLHKIRDHFVESGKFSQAQWDSLLSDPEGFTESKEPVERSVNNLETVYRTVKVGQRANKFLMDDLVKLVSDPCKKIVEIGRCRELTIALIYGMHNTSNLVSYNQDNSQVISDALSSTKAKRVSLYAVGSTEYPTRKLPSEHQVACDILVNSTITNGDELRKFLQSVKNLVQEKIIVTNSKIYKNKGLGETIGFNTTLNRWLAENTDWELSQSYTDGTGMVVLSKIYKKDKEEV